MEAVGAGASVLTFLAAALGTTKVVYETLSSVKDGPHNVGKAAEAILQLRQILEQVKHLSVRAVDDTLLNYTTRCIADLNLFAGKVTKLQVTPGERKSGKVWKRLKAFVSEKELDEIINTISKHCGRLNLQSSIIASNSTFELRDNFAHSTNAVRNLERAAHKQLDFDLVRHRELQSSIAAQGDANTSLFQEAHASTSETQGKIIDRLDSLQETLDGMGALSISDRDAKVMQQILQHLQLKPTTEVPQGSGVIGEILDDGSQFYGQKTAEATPGGVASDSEHRLSESIKRLSQLVHEKEQQFDTFDDTEQDCTSIIEDLRGILDAATQEASIITGQVDSHCQDCRSSAGEISQSLRQFDKRFAFNTFIVNPEDRMISRKRKRPLQVVEKAQSYNEMALNLGVFSVKRKKQVWTCSCDEGECHSCKSQQINTDVGVQKERHTDCTTTVTLISRGSQRQCMLIATDYVSRATSTGDLSSISYLAINPILPLGSKVFQLVKEGRLQELREMIQNGEASLRDCDEEGSSLLFYSTKQPQLCKFLLDNGLDVDHVGTDLGEFKITALQNEINESDLEVTDETSRVDECRELLLAAGADPLTSYDQWESASFFNNLAARSQVGAVATFARKAIFEGSTSMADILNARERGQNLLHIACQNFNYGSTIENVSAILGLGFDINAVDRWGHSCLDIFVQNASPSKPIRDKPGVIREQEILVFLIQNGANHNATVDGEITVSQIAYEPLCRYGTGCGHGSYHGDLWDSVLHICGYDISEYRAGYTRKAKYTGDDTKVHPRSKYTRAQFELLWQGRETQCPYWDDQPWPLTAGSHVENLLEEVPEGEEEKLEGCICDGYERTKWEGESLSDREETEYDDEADDATGVDAESHFFAAAEEEVLGKQGAETQGDFRWNLGDQNRAFWSQQGGFEVGDPESTEAISAALPIFELTNPWLADGAQEFYEQGTY